MKARKRHLAAVKNERPLLVVLHGPNLNLLGERPAEHYGTMTLPDLDKMITQEAEGLGWRCLCLQTNHEGTYIDCIHEYRHAAAMIVNPGAWTHYSYAIRDALELVTCPIAEVHLSDIASREEWRRHSVIRPVVDLVVSGKGPQGYLEAARTLIAMSSSGPDSGETGDAGD